MLIMRGEGHKTRSSGCSGRSGTSSHTSQKDSVERFKNSGFRKGRLIGERKKIKIPPERGSRPRKEERLCRGIRRGPLYDL